MQKIYKQIFVKEFGIEAPKIVVEHQNDLEFLKSKVTDSKALVKLHATPFNPLDFQKLLGTIPGIQLPFTPGSEGSGIIVDSEDKSLINKNVSFGSFQAGSWREYQLIDLKHSYILPQNVNMDEGACAFINPFTSYGLVQRALQYKSGGVINLAANSALGHMVNKLCKHFGLKCLNVIRGDQNRVQEMKQQFENDLVISSDQQDFTQQIKDISSQFDIRVAFDPIGGSITGKVFNNLPRKGVVIVYGSLSGKDIEGINGVQVRWGDKRLEGFTVINYFEQESEQELKNAKEFISQNFDNIFRSKILKSYSFDDVLEAYQQFKQIGGGQKIILKP